MGTVFNDPTIFTNSVKFAGDVDLPAGAVTDDDVQDYAGIGADKLEHPVRKMGSQSGNAAAATQAIHLVNGTTGTIKSFKAGSIAACTGNATITVDLKQNGSSVLSAVITLDNANTARVAEAATISSASVVAGDLLEVVVAVNAGTGALGTGLFWELALYEDAV